MKLSIIIPVYNTGKYIEKCILSALAQNIPQSDYEILVINDGSEDLSYNKAANLARQFENIHVYSKHNKGLSKTRNFGTDRARGKYVMYLDSDDFIEPNVLRQIIDAMDKDSLDMLSVNMLLCDENGRCIPARIDKVAGSIGEEVLSGKDILRKGSFNPFIYTYIYNREFLNRHKLRFYPGWYENEEFTPRALYHASRLKYIPLKVFNFVQRPDSVSNNGKTDSLFDLANGMQRLNMFAQSISTHDPEGSELLRRRITKVMYHAIRKVALGNTGQTRRLINYCRRNKVVPLYNYNKKFKIFLLNYNTSLFLLYYKIRSKS